mmetsp:Transcript_35125/g.75851  ORF Transcript_35125/g.75851 Transcript_35125/m.75851 type:complete len:535 (+) Transcript_35125:98-1702(+)
MNKENQVNVDTFVADSAQSAAELCDSKPTRRSRQRNRQARNFAARTRTALGENSSEYKLFRKVLRAYKANSMSTSEVVQHMQNVFEDHRELMVRFNAILPLEHKVVLPPEKSPSANKKNSLISFDYEEDPPLETELLAVKKLERELGDLQTKKLQLAWGRYKHKMLEDTEWQIILAREAIRNIKLGIELRSKKSCTATCDHSATQKPASHSIPNSVSENSSDHQIVNNKDRDMHLQKSSLELKHTRDLGVNEASSRDDINEGDIYNELVNLNMDPKAKRGTLDAIKWLTGQCQDNNDSNLSSRAPFQLSPSLSALSEYESSTESDMNQHQSREAKQCGIIISRQPSTLTARRDCGSYVSENLIIHIDTSYSTGRILQRVEDPATEETRRQGTIVWSDIEKCIFLDSFFHHPKKFRKISSFLPNKTTKDCVQYYYDSKQNIPYKQASKEFRLWKKSPDVVFFDATVVSLLQVGAITKDENDSEKFILPEIDLSRHTRQFDRLRLAVMNKISYDGKAQAILKGGGRNTRASKRTAR